MVYQRRNEPGSAFGGLFVEVVTSGRRTRITHLGLGRRGVLVPGSDLHRRRRSVIFQLPRDLSVTSKWDLWSVP
jgi:hypothetical protein